jgi:uncharacterized membrane protein YgdD (TMEM256/DUF423 family)
MMEKTFVILGALSAFIGVAAGAFGAHGLKPVLGADMLAVFDVGVRYQLVHALALVAVAWVQSRWPSTLITASGWLFVIGTILFSGSLYALSVSGMRGLGLITPFGGVAFLVGWACMAWGVWKA